MKSALLKDTFSEIKNSFGRFVSIFAIVTIGCGFFSGIKATMPDMKDTAKSYFSDNNLADITLRSDYGVTDSDVKAIKNTDGVKGAAAGYSKDLFYSYKGKNLVLKAISFDFDGSKKGSDNLNKLILSEGRLPEKTGECVVEKKLSSPDTFKIGETLALSEPDKSKELSESLKHIEYKIVGIAYSPAYIGYERDKTNVGNGTVDSNIFISKSEFKSDYYTELYVTFDKTQNLEPFSDEYKDAVADCATSVQKVFENGVNKRFDDIKAQAQQKIDSAVADADSYEAFLNYDNNTLSALSKSLEADIAALQGKSDRTDEENSALKEKTDTKNKADMLISARNENNKVILSEMENELVTARLQIESSRQELSKMKAPTIYLSDRFDSADYASYSQDSERVDNVAKVFPVFFIVVAALVCLTTMTRMIDEKRTEIGTYKALGYSEAKIASKYLVYASLAAVTGSTVGVYIGLKTLPAIIFNAYHMLYNIPSVQTPFRWNYYILCLLCSLAVTSAAVLASLHRELKAQPSQIMRPKAPPAGKRVILERIPFIWNRLSFLSKVTVRNLLRYKKRFLMSVIGVAGCTALMLTGFGLKRSISAIAEKPFENVFIYDGAVSANTEALQSDKDISDSLSQYEEISEFLPASIESFDAEANDERQSAYVIAVDDFTKLRSFVNLTNAKNGKKLSSPDSGVIITQKLSKLLNLKVGDSISLSSGTEIAKFKIQGIAENYVMHYVFMTSECYKNGFGEEVKYNSAYINLLNDADSTALSEKLISSGDFIGISYTADTGGSFKESMGSLDAIVWVLIICAGGLAVIVLYNLANINITERVREIATIKVLGFYDGEVASYIYRENIISTLIGILLGFGAGVILHKFVIYTAEVDLVMFERELVWWAYALSALLTAVFAAAVNFVLYFKLGRVKMVESLKSVE